MMISAHKVISFCIYEIRNDTWIYWGKCSDLYEFVGMDCKVGALIP